MYFYLLGIKVVNENLTTGQYKKIQLRQTEIEKISNLAVLTGDIACLNKHSLVPKTGC